MKRLVLEELKQWKESKRRKPLIVEGARQVGKTWIVKEFGRLFYKHLAYINFEEEKQLRGMFEQDYDVDRILRAVRTFCKVPCIAGETLIFFDEIQEAKDGLTVLKYFREKAPEQHVVVAGSLLGIALHQGISFPVGMVNFIKMYPMNFVEFLDAVGETELSLSIVNKEWDNLSLFHAHLTDRLKQYYYVGGMPEAVATFADDAEWEDVRAVHHEILRGYDDDFSKHAPGNIVPRLRQIWASIPRQLSKENKKFIFGLVKEGARAREYEIALQWLIDAGLLYSVHNVTAPGIPLSAYRDDGAFKIYLNDLGLLSTMSNLDSATLLYGNDVFTVFKGAITEQYAFQQLLPKHELFYWSKSNALQEVDFLIQDNQHILPIEVKAEENVKAKSLKQFVAENSIPHAIRTSMKPYREEEWLTNLPLYCL